MQPTGDIESNIVSTEQNTKQGTAELRKAKSGGGGGGGGGGSGCASATSGEVWLSGGYDQKVKTWDLRAAGCGRGGGGGGGGGGGTPREDEVATRPGGRQQRQRRAAAAVAMAVCVDDGAQWAVAASGRRRAWPPPPPPSAAGGAQCGRGCARVARWRRRCWCVGRASRGAPVVRADVIAAQVCAAQREPLELALELLVVAAARAAVVCSVGNDGDVCASARGARRRRLRACRCVRAMRRARAVDHGAPLHARRFDCLSDSAAMHGRCPGARRR